MQVPKKGEMIMKTFGIDVSSYQKEIDWKRIKDKIGFALIRAGYGKSVSQCDDFFERNYSECLKYDIPCGAYWYSYALNTDDAIREAEAFLEVIKGKKFKYPVYFDIEDSSQSDLGMGNVTRIAEAFCKKIENNGFWVGIYSYKSFLENNISPDARNRFAVWLAHTGVEKTNYSGQFGIWQFSHTGTLDGISGNVDCNYCYINYPELMVQSGLNNINKTPEKNKSYTVEKNDTLWDIAVKFYGNGSDYKKIKDFNNLNSDTIYPGQILQIPE